MLIHPSLNVMLRTDSKTMKPVQVNFINCGQIQVKFIKNHFKLVDIMTCE
jgi:hypothetical protein